MRTVASRVVHHTPSHYAMLGVPRDFTEAQLRKQYKLLARRFHPDAATRNGIDPDEATERFRNMQTAYEVLSDPQLRRRYDIEQRLRLKREWRRAWGAPQLVDRRADWGEDEQHAGFVCDGPPAVETAQGPDAPLFEEPQGGVPQPETSEVEDSGEAPNPSDPDDLMAAERAAKARRWDTERLAWLQSQIEAQEASLSAGGLGARVSAASRLVDPAGGSSGSAADDLERRLHVAKQEEAEARARAAEAEKALRQAKDKARRKAHEAKLRREADEAARREEMERSQREDEEKALEVEARVRRQVDTPPRRAPDPCTPRS